MKTLSGFLLCSLLFGLLSAAPDGGQEYERLLAAYVREDGVDYDAWSRNEADRMALADIAKAIGRASLEGMNRDEKLAFYLNAYNAWMLELVMRDYPLRSVKQIGLIPFSVFFFSKIEVAGETVTLDRLEKKIIIRDFQEPRIHFAINCASRSCPPLSPEPFAADRLNEQLDAVTRAYANSSGAARLFPKEERVELVEIFKWYKEDFTSAGGAIAFLNRYRVEPIPADFKVGYYDYDWSLNEAP